MQRLTVAATLILLPALSWSAEFCSDQYKNASEMVHSTLQRYDTLYSGGDHWHGIDDIGPTLDLYRLWRNLPDWRLRKLHQLGLDYDTYSQDVPREVEQLQWIAERSDDTGLQPQQKFDAIVGLDLAGAVTKPADAWLETAAGYSPQWLWLQLAMAASDAPWAIVPHLAQANALSLPAYSRLKDLAWHRYAESGGIEWAVVAQTLTPTGTADTHADSVFQQWQSRVERCTASPGEYAAWAIAAPLRWASAQMNTEQIADLAKPFRQLPPAAQLMAIRNLSWQTQLTALQFPYRESGPGQLTAIARLASSSPSSSQAWVNVARTYQASSIDELVAIHRDQQVEAKSARAFNLLSANDMTRLAKTPGLSPDMHKALLLTAFTRHVALGNTEQAQRLLPQLQQLSPEFSQRIQKRLQQDWPEQIRLELIVLDDPSFSTWLIAADDNTGDVGIWLRNAWPQRDLPRELASAAAIQQDLETWLQLPQKWYRFYGMRGFTLGALDRIHASPARTTPLAELPPTLINTQPGQAPHHLEKLIAWNELPQLVEGNGLSRKISHDIVEWVDNASANWLKRRFIDQESAAQALRQVILLNRQEDGGLLGQIPSGQAAFMLLHKRFPDSEATKQTPYWYR